MFVIDSYPEIIMHLKALSTIFKKESSGWYSMFCPYCDDAVRKPNPRHGHFHVAPTYPFAHCFRCGTKVGLHKLLIDTGFKDARIIKKLKSVGSFTYSHSKGIKSNKQYSEGVLFEKLKEQYSAFYDRYPNGLEIYYSYIYERCVDVNPIRFYMVPTMESNILGVRFLNYDGNIVTTRLINSAIRYKNPTIRHPYYFQDISKLFDYKDVVIMEGAFDAVNLYCYYPKFKDAFFLAIGGNNYSGTATELITNYLLIGHYNIHIVLDQGLQRMKKIINTTNNIINQLNTEIHTAFYLPTVSKDVSECMFLNQIA